MTKGPSIDMVVPVFNERDCLDELVRRVHDVIQNSPGYDFRLVLVDDGSTDGSTELIQQLAVERNWIEGIFLSRNFGHQAAVTAGMDATTGDWVAVLDADLQDPPELIPAMVDHARSHHVDVVYGARADRRGETRFKRHTASLFYRGLRLASGLDIPLDTGDFRVASQRAVDSLRRLPEHNRLLRALTPWVGWSSLPYPYERHERYAGSTKYPLGKMLILAAHAVFGFSTLPIRLIQLLGLALATTATITLCSYGALTALGSTMRDAHWLAALVTALAGLVLMAIGTVGGYVYRIQDEVKGRPIYVRTDTPIGERRKRAPFGDPWRGMDKGGRQDA